MKINALGLIEVRGLVAAIEAADAMVKSANVRILKQHNVTPGLITVIVEGDVAACRAAVDAGVAAVNRLGDFVVGRIEIPRPGDGLDTMLFEYLKEEKDPTPSKKTIKSSVQEDLKDIKNEPPLTPDVTKKTVENRSEAATKSTENIEDSSVKEKTAKDDNKSQKSAPNELIKRSLVAYIKEAKRGRSLKEIKTKFDTVQNLSTLLADLTKSQQVVVKQMRYHLKK